MIFMTENIYIHCLNMVIKVVLKRVIVSLQAIQQEENVASKFFAFNIIIIL